MGGQGCRTRKRGGRVRVCVKVSFEEPFPENI